MSLPASADVNNPLHIEGCPPSLALKVLIGRGKILFYKSSYDKTRKGKSIGCVDFLLGIILYLYKVISD